MKSLILYLFRDKKTAAMLLVSSLIIGICALAPSLFVIVVLNKYLASGVTATLVSLAIGAVLAIAFEFVTRIPIGPPKGMGVRDFVLKFGFS